ncbi:MAG TPA: hypothetical protein VMW48_07575 [Vicinamibacterales bacterium]|nr:hypothetical protein [Vicinamibacterales bacterium]
MRSPLVDAFRRADVPKDVRMDAAAGLVAPRGQEQLALFAMLVDDPDGDVREVAERTLATIQSSAIAAVLARSDTPADLIRFFNARGITPVAGAPASDSDAPLVEMPDETPEPAAGGGDATLSMTQQIQNMGIVERVRVAMKGTREARAMLVRDPNKMVSSAVLSSPKLTMAEVESFAKMANVSDDVLRAIAQNRGWVKNYGVAHGLVKNPKTPVAMSLNLMQRLVDRDIRSLAVDRNVPEPLRLAARKRMVKATS